MKKSEKQPFISIKGEFVQADISEASFGDTGGKRELLVTLLQEGPGNKFHNNYYTASALESVKTEVMRRPKQYYNHAKNTDDPERDIRDWCSTVKEVFIDKSEGKAKLKARVKVLDDWLWERAQKAPGELAVSIEGKGIGRTETIEGQSYNAIYSVPRFNGVNWVDYPGNAGMGVDVLESQRNAQEEKPMELKDVLEAVKGLSPEQMKEVAALMPEIKEKSEPVDSSKELSSLRESVAALKTAVTAKDKEYSDRLAAVEKEKNELANKVEAHQIKERENEKSRLVDSLLAASKLKAEHKTVTFKKTLESVKEYKDGDKVISESDQMKQLIEDREAICIAPVATPDNAGASKPVAEEDKVNMFCKNVLGIDLPVEKKEEKK
jgi:hypothetical protein